jgi:hypothetical protein
MDHVWVVLWPAAWPSFVVACGVQLCMHRSRCSGDSAAVSRARAHTAVSLAAACGSCVLSAGSRVCWGESPAADHVCWACWVGPGRAGWVQLSTAGWDVQAAAWSSFLWRVLCLHGC